MNPFTLYQRRYSQGSVVNQIILSFLHTLGDPLLRYWISHVELTSPSGHVPGETSCIEGIGSGVDPIGDIALNELRRLLFDCHARK